MGWFDESLKTFEAFSLSHLLAIGFFILLIGVMITFRHALQRRPKLRRGLELGAAVMMLALQAIFYVWTFALGEASWELLPLGMCHLSMYLTSLALILNNEKIFRFIFPWAVMGSILSLVIADLLYEFPHFRFFHYFLNHGTFLTANLYLLVVRKWRFPYRSLLISAGILLVFSLMMRVINPLLGTNHLFMDHLPVSAQPLYYWLGDPWWILGFMFSVVIMFHLVYGLSHLLKKWAK